MTSTATPHLEATLRDLLRLGTLVKDRGYRQVWRFDHDGRGYYLKFYPRHGERDRWRRLTRGSPAALEFVRLQWLQKAGIPAPRAVALLNGFAVGERQGDAVVLQAIEPSVSLDEYLIDLELRGENAPDHRQLADQVIEVVRMLGAAGLGHDDLHLGNFLVHDHQIYLIDAYAVRRGGLRRSDVLHLGASVDRFATVTDLLRGWRRLESKTEPPAPENNAVSRRLWNNALKRINGNNRYFGRLSAQGWGGVYFRMTKHPRRWSIASRLNVQPGDWEQAWPDLLARLEADALPVLKRSASGDVIAADVTLAGQTVPVILKRPRRRYWYRYLNEIGRGARPRRAWRKAWELLVRNLPTAWPLAVFERRRLGYVVDTILICERVDGPMLWTADLDAMPLAARDLLFRRAGHILRTIDRTGLSHFDAKASNWIVHDDAKIGPLPVLIDVDGIRRRHWPALGIQRLLRSLRAKRQYTTEDSLSLCQGYAPYARLQVEEAAEEPDPAAAPDPSAAPVDEAS